MFGELDGDATNDGEEQRMQMQQNMQNDMPMQDFGGSGDEMDDFLNDAPLPDDDDDLLDDTQTLATIPPKTTVPSASSTDEMQQDTVETIGEEEEDEEPLAPSQLGNALDSLMMHWCQLLTNVSVKAPVPPPSTLDHVKEVAEVCSKHFRDASVDVNNEFTRLGIQWEMEQCLEQSVTEDTNLDEVIERQSKLIDAAREILRTRVEAFNLDNPNAGKQFTT